MHGELYYISEMAQLFDLSRQTLIHYDRIGLFSPAVVNDEGYRLYAPTQIPDLRLICLLRDMGVGLKDIAQLVRGADVDGLTACLSEQRKSLTEQITALEHKRDFIDQRLHFFDEVRTWQKTDGKPVLRHLPARTVVFQPWNVGPAGMNRAQLHQALMRAVGRLHAATGVAPVAGWGAIIRRDAFVSPAGGRAGAAQDSAHAAHAAAEDGCFAGAGSYVVAPEGVSEEVEQAAIEHDVRAEGPAMSMRILPAGVYVCQTRCGMPYDRSGIDALRIWLDEHHLEPVGDVVDACLLDATAYTETYQEDFCCLQAPLSFD